MTNEDLTEEQWKIYRRGFNDGMKAGYEMFAMLIKYVPDKRSDNEPPKA